MSEMSKYLGEDGFKVPEDTGEGDFSFLPTAWYPVEITKAEIKENKPKEEGGTSTGARFVVEFTVFGEKYANRKVWNGNGFNFIHASQQAQAIGQQELSRLAKACGYGVNDRLRNESELLGKQLEVYVETEPGTNGYKDKNPATKFRSLGSGGQEAPQQKLQAPSRQQLPATNVPQQTAPDQSAVLAAGGAGKRPWEK